MGNAKSLTGFKKREKFLIFFKQFKKSIQISCVGIFIKIADIAGIFLFFYPCVKRSLRDLRLFYTARRILKEKLDRKPITLAAWKQEYDRLQAEYAKLSPQYKPLREDLMKMRRVQYCVDRVLQRRQPEQEAPKKKQDIEL